LQPLSLAERGGVRSIRATVLIAHLPANTIGPRERAILVRELGIDDNDVDIVTCEDSAGPGNVVYVTVECENVTAVFTAFGERDRSSESVAGDVVKQVRVYLDAGVPVEEHLADQLLIPMALAGRGGCSTVAPSSHTETNIHVIERFLDVHFRVSTLRDGAHRIEVEGVTSHEDT
jgi:RNA 3'-terminal phosphate cyclase (ATP)